MFELLKNRAIINILIGDKKFEKYRFQDGTEFELSMPYLTGSAICQLSMQFGLPANCNWGNSEPKLSRWQYMENLLEHCIQNNTCSDLLAFLFDRKHFDSMLAGHSVTEIDNAYNYALEIFLRNINYAICFSNQELKVVNQKFVMRNINEKIEVKATNIRNIDRDYIRDIVNRALRDIAEGNFDSAITKSRTLLEEVFCYVIERKQETLPHAGDINKLYQKVKDIYEMHGSSATDKRIKTLLSGLEKIVTAVAELRNNESDAHGHVWQGRKLRISRDVVTELNDNYGGVHFIGCR